MAINDAHGVVVAYVRGDGVYSDGRSVPAIHLPYYSHGKQAMGSGNWELFPNLDTALEAKYYPCQFCFPGVEQQTV